MKPALTLLTALLLALPARGIEPTWESMAANYRCPDWFQDGKIGVWIHWGIPSAIDENRSNDGGKLWRGSPEDEGGRQGENHTDFTQEDIRFTAKGDNLYAFVLAAPTKDIVIKTLATGGLLDREIAGIELPGGSPRAGDSG